MIELIEKLMEYSFAHSDKGPGGFLFFVFLIFSTTICIVGIYYIVDLFKSIVDNIRRWRIGVAETNAKSKKNDMSPKIIDAQIDLNIKVDNLSNELKDGITHLSNKIQ